MDMYKQWLTLISEVEKNEEAAVKVNEFFNYNFDYIEDSVLWRIKDYWATPKEFILKGAGDCEDFAIAKYFTLKYIGIEIEDLELTYCMLNRTREYHMVLVYKREFVLDNAITDNIYNIKDKIITPIYSFNEKSFWIYLRKPKLKKEFKNKLSRLSKWNDLLGRVNEKNKL